MANTPKVKAPEAKEEATQPNPQMNERNTTQMTVPQNADPETRVDENVQMVINRTGQAVKDAEALVGETRDQLMAEAKANQYRDDPKLDTLTLEQLDHQRTLQAALGIGREEDTQSLFDSAKERAEGLKDKKRDTSKDNIHNAVPANWRIKPLGDGLIEAVNIITHKEFKGEPKDLLKAD